MNSSRDDCIQLLRPCFFVFLGLSIFGCLPIPSEREILLRPAVDFLVESEESGKPVEGANVLLCRKRIGPPPSELLDVWTATTNSKGEASFSYKEGKETVYPLMMHGKSQRRWQFGVRAEGYEQLHREAETGATSSVDLLTEEMDYEPEELGEGLEDVHLRVGSNREYTASIPGPCRNSSQEAADTNIEAN